MVVKHKDVARMKFSVAYIEVLKLNQCKFFPDRVIHAKAQLKSPFKNLLLSTCIV